MSNLEALNCPVCLFPFDAGKKVPKVFPTCGHTVCKECLLQVLEMYRPKCPLDQLKFGGDFKTIDAFPTNFLGKDLLERRGSWNQCESHKEPNKMICLTDNTLVCSSCVIFGDHRSHDVKLLSDFADLAKAKRDELQAISDTFLVGARELEASLESKKEDMKKMIKHRFRCLYLEINKAEFETLAKLEDQFIEEKLQLSSSLPQDDVKTKLKDFDNLMLNQNVLKLIKEDFSDFKRTLEEKLTLIERKQKETLSELSAIFENNQGSLLKDLNIAVPRLTQELLKFNEKNVSQRKDIFILSPTWSYDHEPGTNDLKITDFIKLARVLKQPDLKEITKVSYNFKLKDELIESSVISALKLLSESLVNVESISLKLECRENSYREIAFYSLMSSIFTSPEKLKSIEIYAPNVVLGDFGPLYLFENVLPKVKDLQEFDCTLYETQSSSNVLKALNKINFAQEYPNLKKLRLNLAGATWEEQDIIQFLELVPDVEDLLLGFGHTALTDQELESFSTKILPSLNKVRRLEVGFWRTRLTESGVSKFLANLPNISTIWAGFRALPISDAVIQDFLDKKIPKLENLFELKFNLGGTNVSQSLAYQLEDWKKIN